MRTYILIAGVCLCTLAGQARGAGSHQELFTRDSVYEQYLHVQANPDEKITPARVLRWMMGLRGHAIAPPTTEFQPVVDADQEHRIRVVAALTYKFF
jgi:hypothetical protein